MSLENDQERVQKAMEKYSNWEERRTEVLEELKEFRNIRRFYHSQNNPGAYVTLNIFLKDSEVLKTVRAAELFPDEPNPRFFVAWSVSDDHTDVRKLETTIDPSLDRKVRISGEVIVLKDETKFFLCDPIQLKTGATELSTGKNYLEVSNILLDRGYIPVDAEFRILPIDNTKDDLVSLGGLEKEFIDLYGNLSLTESIIMSKVNRTKLENIVHSLVRIIQNSKNSDEVERGIIFLGDVLAVFPGLRKYFTGQEKEKMVQIVSSKDLMDESGLGEIN
jgi:hypothetical protein